jgi:hypothetical protein
MPDPRRLPLSVAGARQEISSIREVGTPPWAEGSGPGPVPPTPGLGTLVVLRGCGQLVPDGNGNNGSRAERVNSSRQADYSLRKIQGLFEKF